jgi:hypothetical protein
MVSDIERQRKEARKERTKFSFLTHCPNVK